jgi:putative alpha-1,2-mannosidase
MSSGYVSNEAAGDSASLTLSYAYDDFILGGLSDLVGDAVNAESAFKRSKNYRNIWSDEKQFMCTRTAAGELLCPRTATSPDAWTMYREGDALHWTTFVPHDPEGLQQLYGSKEAYLRSMDMFFEERFQSQSVLGNAAPNPYYWAGNEVDAFAVWMYSFGAYGDCTRTQYWSRNITHEHYSNTAHGIPGNEDYGAMSTWLLFASLGVFPQAGTTNFVIGSPRVRSASLRLVHIDGSSSTLSIRTVDNSAENVYVGSLLVNGKEHRSPFIDRSVLAAPGGCTLVFQMTAEPRSNLCPSK